MVLKHEEEGHMVRRIFLVFSISFFMNGIAFSAPGDLDGTFGSNGIAIFDGPPDSGEDYARAVVQQPNGNIVVLLQSVARGENFIRLLRYHPDGSLDRTFGSDGVSNLSGSQGKALSLQKDGNDKRDVVD